MVIWAPCTEVCHHLTEQARTNMSATGVEQYGSAFDIHTYVTLVSTVTIVTVVTVDRNKHVCMTLQELVSAKGSI